MSWSPHVTVAAIIERQGRFLMVEEHTNDGIRLNQPAGHLEAGESLLHAVVRETREETAQHFRPRHLVGVYRWQLPPGGITYLRFCFAGDGGGEIHGQALDSEILATHWLSREQVAARRAELRSPLVLRCIDDWCSGQRHPLKLLHEVE
jgi:ADP-ribose pyrophosphatase YjhB (NUDIX family)